MIEYSNEGKDLLYFAGEGSWGDASDIVIIDPKAMTKEEAHFLEEVEGWSDWERPDFVRWNLRNLHDPMPNEDNYNACQICEYFDPDNRHKTLVDVLADIEEWKEG